MLVNLSNGYRVKVTEIGNVKLAPKITLYNIVFIPSYKYNLISISYLIISLKCITSFSDSSCVLQGPTVKRPLEIGKMQNGLYLLSSTCLHKSFTSTTLRDPNNCLSSRSGRIGPPCNCFSYSLVLCPM